MGSVDQSCELFRSLELLGSRRRLPARILLLQCVQFCYFNVSKQKVHSFQKLSTKGQGRPGCLTGYWRRGELPSPVTRQAPRTSSQPGHGQRRSEQARKVHTWIAEIWLTFSSSLLGIFFPFNFLRNSCPNFWRLEKAHS